jgi:replicative DNA helicase
MTVVAAEIETEDEVAGGEEIEVAYGFNEDFQTKIVALALRDPTFLARTEGLIKPDYLTNVGEAALFDLIRGHYARFRSPPDKAALGVLLKEAVASKKIRSDILAEVKDAVRSVYAADISGGAFAVEKVAEFARERAVEKAMIESVGRLEKGDFAGIEKAMREALLVGEGEADTGYDFFEQIEGRTETRVSIMSGTKVPTGITTGVEELDALLYHRGWGLRELSLIMGPAKGGKSLALGEFA